MKFDDKGKFYTDWVSKTAVQATLQTVGQLVRGTVHVREGERLKDELDRDEPFLAVTDATVVDAEGRTLFEGPFLAVRRSQIVWVMPEAADPKDQPR
ncbi:MAG: hypothetical protein V1755_12115 [Chloroflexota bacterium]